MNQTVVRKHDLILVILFWTFTVFFSLVLPSEASFLNERHVYIRGEKVTLEFQSSAVEVAFDIDGLMPQKIRVVDGKAFYSFDSNLLRVSNYHVQAKPVHKGKDTQEAVVFPITIAPVPNPQRYPVWHWGAIPSKDMAYWTQRGFNGFSTNVIKAPLGNNDKLGHGITTLLEEGARAGADIGLYFHPLIWPGWSKREEARCILPSGQLDAKKVYPLVPEVVVHSQKTVQSWTAHFADYPSFRHALLSSEYSTPFCMNESTIALAKHEAGIDLKAYLKSGAIPDKGGKLNLKNKSVLKIDKGIIADDNTIYRTMLWWWQQGNGVGKLNAMMSDIIHDMRKDVLVWHDPYRLAPVYNTHKGLDAISTWTYGHPDIKRLGYTRVLQAAARKDNLKVMQTITLFVYGQFVMPDKQSLENLLLDRPDGSTYFNNGPDYVSEAMWLVFSQRPDIISFFNTSKLYPNNREQSPALTSPETFDAIGEICHTLIEPYGPAILQGKPRQAKVAVLMSASAIWFRQHLQWYGYPNESILPFCALLMMNHIPFDVLLDEDIVDGRLAAYDMLIIPYGDALTRTVHRRIVGFADMGKTVIADTTLQSSIPGAHILDMDFSFMNRVNGTALKKGNALTAEEYQMRMDALAAELEPKLAGLFRPYRCINKRVLINEVTSGDVRYVFVINDKKRYGPRFGKWKLTQELGVEQETEIGVSVTGKPIIYDALSHTPIEYRFLTGYAGFSVTLPPARGKLLAILPRAIQQVKIVSPEYTKRGNQYTIRLAVLDAVGHPIKGALPLRIDLTDAAGRNTEYSRYAATVSSDARGWGFDLTFTPAINDLAGQWRLNVSELLSGKAAQFKVIVQ